MTAPTGRIHTVAGGLYTGFRIFVHFHEFNGGTHRAEVIPTSSSWWAKINTVLSLYNYVRIKQYVLYSRILIDILPSMVMR